MAPPKKNAAQKPAAKPAQKAAQKPAAKAAPAKKVVDVAALRKTIHKAEKKVRTARNLALYKAWGKKLNAAEEAKLAKLPQFEKELAAAKAKLPK